MPEQSIRQRVSTCTTCKADQAIDQQVSQAQKSPMIPSHRNVDPASSHATLEARKMAVTDFTIPIPGSIRPAAAIDPSPSRWRTKEFRFYYVVFALVVPVMIYWPVRLSQGESPLHDAFTWELSRQALDELTSS